MKQEGGGVIMGGDTDTGSLHVVLSNGKKVFVFPHPSVVINSMCSKCLLIEYLLRLGIIDFFFQLMIYH